MSTDPVKGTRYGPKHTCKDCGQDFPHVAALREHERVTLCGLRAAFAGVMKTKAAPPTYSGIDFLYKDPNANPYLPPTSQPNYYPGNKFLKMLQAQGRSIGKTATQQMTEEALARERDREGDFLTATVDPAHASLREEIRGLEGRLSYLGEMAERDRRTINLLGAKVEALERQLVRAPSLDAKLHRAIKEPTDYSQVFDADEDGLEEGYNGWPKVKARVVF